MEGSINWASVGISWALSTATTLLIVGVASRMGQKCSKSKTKTRYGPIENLANKTDFMEWCSDKPLKTSSPCPTRSKQLETNEKLKQQSIQSRRIDQDREQNLLFRKNLEISLKENQGQGENVPGNSTVHKLEPTYNLQHQFDNKLSKNSKIVMPALAKENILRNKSELRSEKNLTSKPFMNSSSNNIWKNTTSLPPSALEHSIRSTSINSMQHNKELQPATLIKNLKSSPTEKRRQSYERLKLKKESNQTVSSENTVGLSNTGESQVDENLNIKVCDNKSNEFNSFIKVQDKYLPSNDWMVANQAVAQRPPRPNKPTSSQSNVALKGLYVGNFEFRSGSNSPPPTLLPLTASTSAKKNSRVPCSRHSLSKSLSSDTIPIRAMPVKPRDYIGTRPRVTSLTHIVEVHPSMTFIKVQKINTSC